MSDARSALKFFAAFDDSARTVLYFARRRASADGQKAIVTGHLLHGLVAQPAPRVAVLLAARGHVLESVRSAIDAILPRPTGCSSNPETLTLTADVKAVLHRTVSEAQRLGHGTVVDLHILLAILGTARPRAWYQLRSPGRYELADISAAEVEQAVRACCAQAGDSTS